MWPPHEFDDEIRRFRSDIRGLRMSLIMKLVGFRAEVCGLRMRFWTLWPPSDRQKPKILDQPPLPNVCFYYVNPFEFSYKFSPARGR